MEICHSVKLNHYFKPPNEPEDAVPSGGGEPVISLLRNLLAKLL